MQLVHLSDLIYRGRWTQYGATYKSLLLGCSCYNLNCHKKRLMNLYKP